MILSKLQEPTFNNQGRITQKVWKWELSFLYATHRQDLFSRTVKCHDNILKCFKNIERTRNCIWNHQREITQKVHVWKWELSFLYATDRHDLFFITVKYHDNIPNSIQVTKLHLKPQGEVTQKLWERELSFLYATHRHDLFCMTMTYHDSIP